MCSELTPRARIPDTRIPQLMQPWAAPAVELSTMMSASSDLFPPIWQLMTGWARLQLQRVNEKSESPQFPPHPWPHVAKVDQLRWSTSVKVICLTACPEHSKQQVKVGWWISNSVAALTPSPLSNFQINGIKDFYRTWVRSFCTLVTNWLSDQVLFTRLDWYYGCWKCQPKTCWCCCWFWCLRWGKR